MNLIVQRTILYQQNLYNRNKLNAVKIRRITNNSNFLKQNTSFVSIIAVKIIFLYNINKILMLFFLYFAKLFLIVYKKNYLL